VESSKKNTYVNSAHGIIKSVDNFLITSELNGTSKDTYNIDLTKDIIKFSGRKPDSGTLLIDMLGNSSVTLKYDNYCIEKKFNEREPSIKEKSNCVVDNDELEMSTNYKEAVLNGADPIIKGNLIPVIIESDGTVKKSSSKSNYYSYKDKRWANAVILIDKKASYEDGTIIPEAEIESYFVWIPRYKYQLWNVDNVNTNGF
ncbi:MAG: hypothetical protein RR325_05665, partial [Bacilli bacterium]